MFNIQLINKSINQISINQESSNQLSSSHLLVKCETSPQIDKPGLIKAFEQFEIKYGLDCSKIKLGIERHGKYITNGEYYFKYNSKLNFLQEFQSSKEDVLKLEEFYKTFKKENTYFWTITKKTFKLEKIYFNQKPNRTLIGFEEIDETERNLRQLLYRLDKYGYNITKYILVPEIKDNNDFFNYHYHMILEAYPDINKIRKNSKSRFRDLVYNSNIKNDMANGWINNPILSEIWKEITKDGSYRIKPERIKKQEGVFHYLLSYMNKGIKYLNVNNVPYMYYALKSKKAYRIKGLKNIPQIKYELFDINYQKIIFHYLNINYVNKSDISIESQQYIIKIKRRQKIKGVYLEQIILEKQITEYFKQDIKRHNNNDYHISAFDRKLTKNRLIFTKKYNWEEVEKTFTQQELTKLLNEGEIYKTREGYKEL